MKLAREFFVWKGEVERVNFIARAESYHGTTIGALVSPVSYSIVPDLREPPVGSISITAEIFPL